MVAERKKLKQGWCQCKEDKLSLGEFIFKDDGKRDSELKVIEPSCECGIWKHHYHCESCGGLLQIG